MLLNNALSVLAAFYNKKDEGSFLQKARGLQCFARNSLYSLCFGAKANPKEPETFGGYKKNSANNGATRPKLFGSCALHELHLLGSP